MKLHLGVIDLPYPADAEGLTTGDVAEILEDKYHPMEVFFELHGQEIADALANGMEGALESLLMGAPPQAIARAAEGALSGVQAQFKTFLSSREMEGLGIPGVPTKAALDGVNHRLKKRKGAPRPSFIDTGLYQSSFRAWMSEDDA